MGTQPQAAREDPQLKLRPPPLPGAEHILEGRMHLDVVVTDASGKPVAGLELKDFQLLDNNRPQKIVSFHASDGTAGKAGSQVAIFLVMDTVNSGLVNVSSMRDEVEKFLRQNDGRLAQPVTVVLLDDAGFQVVGQPSRDGNFLAQAVHEVKPSLHSILSAAGGEALLERFQLSAKALSMIVAREVPVPGRKMLIWIGPGWPLLRQPEQTYNARGHDLNFNALASLSNQLREARMVVCSAGGGPEFYVQDFLKPVKSAPEANSGNLAVQVIALHSGGRTLDAGNRSRPAEQLNECLQELGTYYTLTFDPPHAEHAFEYHGLRVTVGKPGLTVHTNAGYYAEP